MRIREVRISGLRSIAPGVRLLGEGEGSSRAWRLVWEPHSVRLALPVAPAPGKPMLSALIGANSAGKSTVLLALHHFFGPTTKLDPELFHGKSSAAPVVVQVTLEGVLEQPGAWHHAHCRRRGKCWSLTVASVWQGERRLRLLQRPDGLFVRQSARDRAEVEKLLPAWRVIWADGLRRMETSLERRSLLGDLVDDLLAQAGQRGALGRAQALLAELATLLARREQEAWEPVAALEQRLGVGLAAITPQPKLVRLELAAGLPTLRDLFARSVLQIDDGVALELERHGLGVQRSLVVAVLYAWCEMVRRAQHDYLFAIEEPEIYLHPHATRVLLARLEEIAARDQVIFTTHAGDFVNRTPPEQIAVVRRDAEGRTRVTQPELRGLNPDALLKVQRYLQEDRSDMFFARAVILVEGQAEYFALPAFARTLGIDLDATGVSVVFVNGIGNFAVYHAILAALGIPHVVMMDGDGKAAARQRESAHLGDTVVVLPHDFEHLLVGTLKPERLLALVNECLARRGRPPRPALGDARTRGHALAELGKPLVGRVAGEMLQRDEVRRLEPVVTVLTAAVRLAGRFNQIIT